MSVIVRRFFRPFNLNQSNPKAYVLNTGETVPPKYSHDVETVSVGNLPGIHNLYFPGTTRPMWEKNPPCYVKTVDVDINTKSIVERVFVGLTKETPGSLLYVRYIRPDKSVSNYLNAVVLEEYRRAYGYTDYNVREPNVKIIADYTKAISASVLDTLLEGEYSCPLVPVTDSATMWIRVESCIDALKTLHASRGQVDGSCWDTTFIEEMRNHITGMSVVPEWDQLTKHFLAVPATFAAVNNLAPTNAVGAGPVEQIVSEWAHPVVGNLHTNPIDLARIVEMVSGFNITDFKMSTIVKKGTGLMSGIVVDHVTDRYLHVISPDDPSDSTALEYLDEIMAEAVELLDIMGLLSDYDCKIVMRKTLADELTIEIHRLTSPVVSDGGMEETLTYLGEAPEGKSDKSITYIYIDLITYALLTPSYVAYLDDDISIDTPDDGA